MTAIKRFKHSREYHAGWWSVTLPPDWHAETTEACWRFVREPTVGALHVSAARKDDRDITDDDLLTFAADAAARGEQLKPVQYPAMTGFCAESVRDQVFWLEWWLRAGHLVLHASYNADSGTEQEERADAERIVASLRPDGGS